VVSTENDPDLTLRAGSVDDVEALATLYGEARRAAVPAMPPALHTAAEDRDWLARRLSSDAQAWVAEHRGRLVGYALATQTWLDQLFVLPEMTGQGVGSALLGLVKALRPGGFALWVFESNEGARRFYRRHGLVELEHTDGSMNEERSPDLRMAWPGRDPLVYLRAEVDDVDDELAVVLARRAALTAAIQDVKPVAGHEGRDPGREAEIAARMAARAPGLVVEEWRRIMHEVISVSLDAAERRSRQRRGSGGEGPPEVREVGLQG
jgi:chorismate mutase/GNAT superfamily N-acetyltransferase